MKRYNFTVEENTPQDLEVALDPELLGKVFENLLAAYNPETKDSARKSTGSYYTPREIVNYMVDESLKSYKGDLRAIKILDPACGSGAFPIGILNRIVELLKENEPDLNVYETKLHLIKNCIYRIDIQSIVIQISKLRFFISLVCEQSKNDDADANYGIQPLPNLESKFIAANTLIGFNEHEKGKLDMDYERLKAMKKELWDIRLNKNFNVSDSDKKAELRKRDMELCLKIEKYLLDNETNPDKEKIEEWKKQISVLEPDANLPEDFRMPLEYQRKLFGKAPAVQTAFSAIDKNKIKRDKAIGSIKNLKNLIYKEERKAQADGLEAEIRKMISWDPYDQNASSPFFDPEWMFGLQRDSAVVNGAAGYFDVVIGKPPYVRQERLGQEYKEFLKKELPQVANGIADLYVYFYGKGLNLLKTNGVLMYITLNKFLKTKYGLELRNHLAENFDTDLIIDFFELPVFEASTDTCITKIINSKTDRETKYFPVKTLENLNITELANGSFQKVVKDETEWKFIDNACQTILNKMYENSVFLKDFVNNKIYRGITTGANNVFIIDENTKNGIILNDEKSKELIHSSCCSY